MREVAVTVLRFAVIRYGVIAASPGGKAKTLVQIFAIGLYVLPLPSSLHWIGVSFMAAAVVLTVVTGADYLLRAGALVSRSRNATPNTESNPTSGRNGR